MFKSELTVLEFDRVLALVAEEAKSVPGKDAIAKRHPLPRLTECENAQGDLADMRRFVQTRGFFRSRG